MSYKRVPTICQKTFGIALQRLIFYVLTKLNGMQPIESNSNLGCHRIYQGTQSTCDNTINWTNDSSRGTHQTVIAFHKRVNIGTTDDNILYLVGHQEYYSQLLRIFIGLQMNAIPMSRFQSKRYLRKCHSQIQSRRSNQHHKITTNQEEPEQDDFWEQGFLSTLPNQTTNTTQHTHGSIMFDFLNTPQ